MNSDDRPIVHLVCNAHLDAIWMWSWDEAAREALVTFRHVINLLREFPEFMFTHNESLHYEWAETYAPELFQEITQLVNEGRWCVSGGWFIQPDCNLPGGETLIRIILEGRRYFKEKFGEVPKVAYNFDAFGHAASLPQLLTRSGFELYIHFRPTEAGLILPDTLYRWRGIDGSEIVSLRPAKSWYSTRYTGQLQEQVESGITLARERKRDVLITWGEGGHGGGPRREDLLYLRTLIQNSESADVRILHSTPEAYWKRIRDHLGDLPVYSGDLQRSYAGCYTSIAVIKRSLRRSESLLSSAERWASVATWQTQTDYPFRSLSEAWHKLMLCTFHDVATGTLIESALHDVRNLFGSIEDTAKRSIIKSQLALLPRVNSEHLSLYVFNPHPRPIRGLSTVNIITSYGRPSEHAKEIRLINSSGDEIPFQLSGGTYILQTTAWQPFIGFVDEFPPLSVSRYEIQFEPTPNPRRADISLDETTHNIQINTKYWVATFSKVDAHLTELRHEGMDGNLLTKPIKLFAMNDNPHGWGGRDNVTFNEPIAPFTCLLPKEVGEFVGNIESEGPAIRVAAHGTIFIAVETLVRWEHTRASISYTFYADLPYFDIEVRLYMQARSKMIKLALPFDLPNHLLKTEIPYGAIERTSDDTEHVGGRWVCLEGDYLEIGVANNGQYGFDVSSDGEVRLSLARGALHSGYSENPLSPDNYSGYYTFMDQEQIDTKFRVLCNSKTTRSCQNVVNMALELNQPLETIFTFHPLNENASPSDQISALALTPDHVVLGAFKMNPDGHSFIARLVETIGVAAQAQLIIEGSQIIDVFMNPFEIKTVLINKVGEEINYRVTDLLEDT